MHTVVATYFLVRAILEADTTNMIIWGPQYILIYLVHVLPCLVQRLNRAELYVAILEYRRLKEKQERTTNHQEEEEA